MLVICPIKGWTTKRRLSDERIIVMIKKYDAGSFALTQSARGIKADPFGVHQNAFECHAGWARQPNQPVGRLIGRTGLAEKLRVLLKQH